MKGTLEETKRWTCFLKGDFKSYTVLTVLFVFAIFSFDYHIWKKERDQALQLFMQRQQWLAQTMGSCIADEMDTRIKQVSYMAEVLTEGEDVNDEMTLRTFKQVSEIGELFVRIHFIDREGYVNVAYSSLDRGNDLRLREKNVFLNRLVDFDLGGPINSAKKTGLAQVTQVGHLADGKKGLMIVAPIYSESIQNPEEREKKFRGVVAGVVDLEHLNQNLMAMVESSGKATTVFGFDENKNLIFGADQNFLTLSQWIKQQGGGQDFLKFIESMDQGINGTGIYHVLDKNGNKMEKQVAAFSRIPINDHIRWSLAVTRSYDDVPTLALSLESWKRHVFFLLMIFSQMLLFLALIAHQMVKNKEKEVELEKERLANLQISRVMRFNQSILNNIPEGIVVTDKNGTIIYMNHKAVSLFATGDEVLVGKHFTVLVGCHNVLDRQEVERHFQNLVTSGKSHKHKLVNYKNQAGKAFPVEIQTVPLRGEDGEINGCCTIIRDVEQEMLLQEKTRQLELFKMVGQLATGMAHKIRNPLTTVKGFIQLLGGKIERKEENSQKYFPYISNEVDEANRIISEFLQLAQPLLPEEGDENLHVILNEIVLLLDTQTLLQHIDVRRDYAACLPAVNLEPAELRQVFLSILQNAYQAMPQGGSLTIRTDCQEDERVCVTIEDTGKGIEPAHLPLITQPYFTTEGRLGLGLAIAKELVESAGGSIEISSRLNTGTKVMVTIPVKGERRIA